MHTNTVITHPMVKLIGLNPTLCCINIRLNDANRAYAAETITMTSLIFGLIMISRNTKK